MITHHTPEYTRQHRIDLAMTFVSSERIIRVDDVIKYTGMWYYIDNLVVLDLMLSFRFRID